MSTYLQKANDEEVKIQHLQRLLLHPPKKSQPGDADSYRKQIRTHMALKARWITMVAKTTPDNNLKLF